MCLGLWHIWRLWGGIFFFVVVVVFIFSLLLLFYKPLCVGLGGTFKLNFNLCPGNLSCKIFRRGDFPYCKVLRCCFLCGIPVIDNSFKLYFMYFTLAANKKNQYSLCGYHKKLWTIVMEWILSQENGMLKVYMRAPWCLNAGVHLQ